MWELEGEQEVEGGREFGGREKGKKLGDLPRREGHVTVRTKKAMLGVGI